MRNIIFFLSALFLVPSLFAQNLKIDPKFLNNYWPAEWITCPGIQVKAYGVYHFRKTFELDSNIQKLIIHISADNRYRLFVNGNAVCSGPARGDLYNWFFETIDIAPYLKKGKNAIAVIVWNFAEYAPVAQISNQTALVLAADDDHFHQINSGKSWFVLNDTSWSPCSLDNNSRMRSYFAIGVGEHINGSGFPWGWEKTDYKENGWENAVPVATAVPDGVGSDNKWTLTPRTIPLMEEKMQRLSLIRRTEGISKVANFLSGKEDLHIDAHQHIRILIDQGYETVAYPELTVSGGKGSEIRLTYAESLFDSLLNKGNRNEINGKKIIGYYDLFEPEGGGRRIFRPLWFRTYRYLELEVTTNESELVIHDLHGQYTGYPFEQKASFSSNDTSLKNIWDIGWRTARLCAGETYFDCPYYEQLQYEGDTRIQSLISLYITGDDRLMRKAINDFYKSRVPIGLTQGRYPSSRLQVIPPFSLYWISMLYDYWMHRKDDEFLKKYLMAAEGVLDWYESKIDLKKGMLGPMNWWNFVDWNKSWPDGSPDGAEKGNSSVITLQYIYTLREAAELFKYFNKNDVAKHYFGLASTLSKSTYEKCFDITRGLMANTPAKNSFSQHASIMGILSETIPEFQRKATIEKLLSDTSISQATFYYRFYLTRAMKKAGLANLYYEQLEPWRNMIASGLTTFAEMPEPTRSDCHAWSASPDYDFLATICGIMPGSPGFSSVVIQPSPGKLTEISGSMPHPDGIIKVNLKRRGNSGIQGIVYLPEHINGKFIWNDKTISLNGGLNKINF